MTEGGTTAGSPEPALHGGTLAVAAARAGGVSTMFTLSGGHVFPLYDAAVHADPPMRLVDVRHEQSAVFAAEATARLTRSPGLAVLTAGPGVTNGVSAITTAHFNGSPVVILGGRAPDYRWGSGSLQEFDHPELLRAVTKQAWTEHETAKIGAGVADAFRLATTPHRGPVFVDIALEALFGPAPPAALQAASPAAPAAQADQDQDTDTEAAQRIASLIAAAQRPVLVLGSDVWAGGAEQAARMAAEHLRLPVITNGQGRGILPAGHELLVTRARSVALRQADLIVVAGHPHSTSAWATARSARTRTPDQPPWCTPPTRPRSWPGTSRWPPRTPVIWPLCSPCWPGPRSARMDPAGPATGCPSCRTRRAPRPPPTASCCPARLTPSTRCASTASCSACSTTTQW